MNQTITLALVLAAVLIALAASAGPGEPENPLLGSWKRHMELKASSEYGLEWVPVGPVMNGARAACVQGDPTRPGTLYAAFGPGGLWKTADNGLTWNPVFENQAAPGIGDVALAPSRPEGLSYQEVIIALMGEKKEGFKRLLKFATALAIILVAVLALFAFTPLADFWFITVSGLSEPLAEVARLPLMIMFFFPALTVLISIQRGVLVAARNTKPITGGTITEFVTIVIIMMILISNINLVGAVAAVIALIMGRLASNIYLMYPTVRSLKN